MNDQNEWTDPSDERETIISYLVENSDLSPLQAKDLINKHSTDKGHLIEIARTMNAEG